jgi:hypothetical protein
MAEAKPFVPVKLVCGIIAGEDRVFGMAEAALADSFGPIDLRSDRFRFEATGYYEGEMGKDLDRAFVSFGRLIEPERLSEIKIRTNALEREIGDRIGADRRAVNLDPGYVTTAALIMATTKNFSHRIPLRQGIYAHLEFLFAKNGLRRLDWTYPDFRTPVYERFFLEVRRTYLGQVRETA